MTLVSVVIPTYNRTDVLCNRALPSVLRQSHQDLEVVIVADGMEGGQLLELERRIRNLQYETQMFLRLWNIPRQVYPEDLSQKWSVLGLNARNWGLDKALGDWIAPLDDDDEWTPDHVEVLLAAALRDNVVVKSTVMGSVSVYPPRVAVSRIE